MGKLIGIGEIAEMFGVEVSTAEKWRYLKQLPPEVQKRPRRWDEDDINAFKAERVDKRKAVDDDQVDEIKTLYEKGGVTQAAIAAKYGIHVSHVSNIVNGKRRRST